MRILCVWGTRPEAIKMAPVVHALRRARLGVKVCVTGQHRELLDQALAPFRIRPDYDLDLMRPGQTLEGLTARILDRLTPVLKKERPELVLCQGDTTTAFAASLAAFYQRLPCGHVEAGLRSHDRERPFPEELNRALADRLCVLRFAPTPLAARNLAREGLREGVYVTGNTVVDALRSIAGRLSGPQDPKIAELFKDGRVLLVTAHRRENFGKPLENICGAVLDLLEAHEDLKVLYPAHPNPMAREAAFRLLKHPRILLTEPMGYPDLLWSLRRCELALSDSGGMQEEAPSLGAAVCVLREVTERPEAAREGSSKLTGLKRERIFSVAHRLLSRPAELARMKRARNPFGDGRAGERIAAAIKHHFELGPRPKDWSPR